MKPSVLAELAAPACIDSAARYRPAGQPSVRSVSSETSLASSSTPAASSSSPASCSSSRRSATPISCTGPAPASGQAAVPAPPCSRPRSASRPGRSRKLREHVQTGRIGDSVQVVEHQHHGRSSAASAPPTRGTRVDQVDPPGPDNASNTSGGTRLDPVNRGRDVPQEHDGVVVSPVERDPRERTRIGLGPPREQRRLAVAGGRDHGRERRARRAQPRDHVRLRHGAGPVQRGSELGLREVERNLGGRHRQTMLGDWRPQRQRRTDRAREGPPFMPIGMTRAGLARRPYSDCDSRDSRSRPARRRAQTATNGVTPDDRFQRHASFHRDARAARDPARDARVRPTACRAARPSSTLYDHLDFVHALNVVSSTALPERRRTRSARASTTSGCEDNAILIFSELMGSESLFLTANADTVYFVGIVDLTSGPMVVETPPQALGAVRRHVVPAGSSTSACRARIAARAAGSCSCRRTTTARCPTAVTTSGTRARRGRCCSAGRSWPTTTRRRPSRRSSARSKIYPYAQGGFGTSVATLLEGDVQPAPPAEVPETVFVEGSGKAFNTIPPSDFGFFELMNELVQDEPAGQHGHRADGPAGRDRDREGQAVRARRADAAASSRRRPPSATRPRGRWSSTRGRRRGSPTTTRSAWFNILFVGGYNFETPPPLVTEEGIKPLPADRRPEAALPNRVLLRLHRDHAGDVHAAHRDRVAVPHRHQGRRRRPSSTARRPTR